MYYIRRVSYNYVGNYARYFLGSMFNFPMRYPMILSVVENDRVEEAIDLADEVCGSLSKAGTGIAFTLPVERVKGLAKEIR